MKALKTVAVALGVTLGALIVIPLVVLAGLFVWLKVTEESDEEALEPGRGRRVNTGAATPPTPDATAAPGVPASRSEPGAEPGTAPPVEPLVDGAAPLASPLPSPIARPLFCGPEVWGEGVVDPPAPGG